MSAPGYTAEALRTHRASLFVFGGSVDDRRVWADDAADQFPDEGPLRILDDGQRLPALITATRGVVFVANILALSWEDQAKLLQCLHGQEERAKWVLGLEVAPRQAVASGTLRPDLWFRLSRAVVDVSQPDVQSRLQKRRAHVRAQAARADAAPRSKPAPKRR